MLSRLVSVCGISRLRLLYRVDLGNAAVCSLKDSRMVLIRSVAVMSIELDCRSCYVSDVGRSITFLFFFSSFFFFPRWFEAPHPHVSTTMHVNESSMGPSSLECNSSSGPAVWTLLVGPLCALTTCMHCSSGQFWGNLRWARGSSARRGGKCAPSIFGQQIERGSRRASHSHSRSSSAGR